MTCDRPIACHHRLRFNRTTMPPEPTRPMKISFGEMRASGIRDLLVYCADYKCSHSIEMSVLTAILADSKVLASKAETDADRLIALKSLGHWVGDIHQPLHVSFGDDRGGNNISVSGQCSGNLHATWDNCLVLYVSGRTPRMPRPIFCWQSALKHELGGPLPSRKIGRTNPLTSLRR
jgi:hypothetical protein